MPFSRILFYNCTSPRCPWCNWRCTCADRAAVPWGLTGLQHRPSLRCSSSLLTCGIRTVLFCLNKPLAVLGWFGEGWRGPWMRMSTAVTGKPNGILQFSSLSPPREAGKFCSSLETADPRHPASGPPKSRTGEEGCGYSQCVSHLWQEIRDQSKLTPTLTGLRYDSQTDTQWVVELKARALSLCLSRVYKHPLGKDVVATLNKIIWMFT